MEKMIVELTKVKETKNYFSFGQHDKDNIILSLYVSKEDNPPEKVKVTIEKA